MATGAGGARGGTGASKGGARASGISTGRNGSQAGRLAECDGPRVTMRGQAASSGNRCRGLRR